jgi:SAM-dependent methyltransferase
MDPQYELDTVSAEETHWWYRGRRRIVSDAVASVGLPAEARILDAGCGSGRNMVELKRFGDVVGVDVSERAIELARARGAGEVELAGLTDLSFENDAFDLVTCLDVIEHLDDDVAALTELRRVTKPAGCLVVTVPAYPLLWSPHDEMNHHKRRYTRRTLSAAAAASGWELERMTHFNALLLAPAALVRILQRLATRGRQAERSDLQRTPAWLNRALERIFLTEARVLKKVDIPAGLSLLAVFRPGLRS